MTNGWVDIKNTDVILAMGGNPAENHPVGFKWFMEARRTRGAKLVVVDPRFTRTAAVADYYAPIRPGSDIAYLQPLLLAVTEIAGQPRHAVSQLDGLQHFGQAVAVAGVEAEEHRRLDALVGLQGQLQVLEHRQLL